MAGLAGHAAAEPCSAAVQLRGDSQLRDTVAVDLAKRGIATLAAPSCEAPIILVQSAEAGLHIAILAQSGIALSERDVADSQTAAVVIESWARPELYMMLLPAPLAPSPAVASVDLEQPPGAVARRVEAAVPGLPPSILTAGVVSAVGRDGSLWMGLTARGCVRVGPACVGALLRASTDTGASGDSFARQTSRTAMELMLAADVSRRFRDVVITTGALAGIGFDRRQQDDVIDGNVEADGGGLRAGVHLAISKSISSNWALGADASADTALFSPTDAVDDDAMGLATQPSQFLRLELQLRYEVR